MEVAVQAACHLRNIRQHGGYFAQVDAVQAQRQVLQHRRVLILGIDLHTRLVVGYQVDFRLNLLVFADEEIVVLVEVELLIADGGALGHHPEAQSFLLHLYGGSQPHAHPALGVIIAQSCQCAVLVDMPVDEGVEDELRIPLVVAHLSLIGQSLALLCQVQAHGVDAGAVVVQRVDVAGAVDTCLWRGVQVERHLLEVDADGSEEIGYGVFALALQMEFHHGEQGLDGRLVDDLLVELRHDGVGEDACLADHLLVASLGVELQDEVAALGSHDGGVCVQLQEYANVARIVGLPEILHIHLVEATADVVGLVHVRFYLQTAVSAYGQVLVEQAHLVEVGLLQVGAHGAFYLLRAEQHVYSHVPVEDLVVTCDAGLGAPVLECRLCRQVVEVHIAVFQQADVSVCIEAALA